MKATFRLGKYTVTEDSPLVGICDTPGDEHLGISVLPGNTRKALGVTLHEFMHAEGVPDKLLDGERDSAEKIAAVLWRMGWRRTGG